MSTVDIAERITTIPNPNEAHTSARITTKRADQGLPSHEKLVSPKTRRTWSTAPPGRKNVLNSTPTMTGESTTGMKKRKRNTFQPRTFSYTNTAETNDAMSMSGTEIKKISELTRTCEMIGLWNISS